IDGNQSLAQAAGSGSLDLDRMARWDDDWATPGTRFKYHAAFHLTHAGIEATGSILADGVAPADVERITLTVNPSILDVCGIADPTTGLEAKFSLRGTQALLIHGVDTAAVASFEDGPINQPEVQAFIPKVIVETDDAVSNMATRVEVVTDGGVRRADHDVNRPNADLGEQGTKLRLKFEALAGPVLGVDRAAALADQLTDLPAVANIRQTIDAAR
ncbi:MAG: hypothetical protein ACR2QK_13495, partial [Acidimicrobiales bacterium]